MFPFRFGDKDTANEFINMLKTTKPSIETIEDLHCNHIIARKRILKEEDTYD